MALTNAQIEEVLGYAVFRLYDASQKEALRERLIRSELEYRQITALFADQAHGGIIHRLVEISRNSDAAAIELGRIIENVHASFKAGYPPTPIIRNLLEDFGPYNYNESIAHDVRELAGQDVAIYNARVIAPRFDNIDAPGNLSRLMANSLHGLWLLEKKFSRELQPGQGSNDQLRLLNDRITANPDDLDARFERAQHSSVPHGLALQDYNYILKRNPNNIAALLGRARINEVEESLGYDLGEGQTALADYRHVLEIEPQNQIALDGVKRLAPPTERPKF